MRTARVIILVAVVCALAGWEALRRYDLVSAILLASPTEILAAASRSGASFVSAFAVTFPTIAVSMVLVGAFGVVVGLLLGLVPVLSAGFGPVLSSIFAIPAVIWYPMFIVWFGIGPESKIVFAFVSGFFPVALSTIGGVQLIDRRYIDVARSFGVGRWRMFFGVLIPLALPVIVSGLRIGLGLVAIAVVVGELVASTSGIGFLISFHRTVFETGEVYFGIVLVLAGVALINVAFGALERRFLAWQTSERG